MVNTNEVNVPERQYLNSLVLLFTLVIIFNRNVHTIIKRSPPEMLEEIVLVDDFSDKGTNHDLRNNCAS